MSIRKLALAVMLGAACVASVQAADPNKVLHVSWVAPETGFDPAKVTDVYSSEVLQNVYDPMITYDYLARPAKLVPNTLTAMPTISGDGMVYTFHLKKGIYFSADPAFKGAKRELTAADYAYSLKRMIDPATGSPLGYLVTGKFVGLDEVAAQAQKTGKFDYDAPVAGVKVLDRYTLQLTLKVPYPALSYILAMPQTGAVAREVIEAYGTNTNAHPVGTGAYMLADWKPGNHVTLVASPTFRKVVFNYQLGPDADKEAREVAAQINGKTMPQIGRIEISVIEEEQPTWLAFKSGELDLSGIPQPVIRSVLVMDPHDSTRAELKSDMKKLGVTLHRGLFPEITFYPFNMKDPTLGGYTKEKIALRRAIAMAFNTDETIRDIRRGQAVKAEYVIPPGVAGHNPNFRAAVDYNPALGNALLDQFGYKIGADGYRTTPEGKPLVVDYVTGPTAIDKTWNEAWQKAFDTLKLRVNFRVMQWNEQVKSMRDCNFGMIGAAWLADYPDGDNFAMLLAGKNVGDENYACYQSPRYDALYRKTQDLHDSPERNALYDQMNKVVMAETPWVFGESRYVNYLTQRWVRGFMYHPILNTSWAYMDIQK